MKTTTILKKVYDLEETDYTGKKEQTLDYKKYMDLIELLKEDVKMESLPEGSTKKQYTAIKRMLNKSNTFRKVLSVTHIDKKGRQVFTDSYILFRFLNDAIINSLPKTTDEGIREWIGNYPQTEKLCDPTFNSSLKSPSVKIKDLKNSIKTEESVVIIDLVEGGSYKAALGKKNLKSFIEIMNFKNSDEINFMFHSLGTGFAIIPLGVKYNNREGIILPVRMEA